MPPEIIPPEIIPITLALPLRLGQVNSYLLRAGTGFVLVDTGSRNRRAELEQALVAAGCRPGGLRLIVLTHGDFDHSGNATYLGKRYGAPIAMHPADAEALARGDMFAGRRRCSPIIRWLAPRLFGFGRADRSRPAVALTVGADLAAYGLDARVLDLPGHSRGSIGLLTAAGDLFCGDLLENRTRPAPSDLVDDVAAMRASLGQVRGLDIGTVYPGHGRPFEMAAWTH